MNIKVENLKKKYSKINAIENFSFSFSNGIYALLGPNGAGKSTLMNVIVGLVNCDEGKIFFNDMPINEAGNHYIEKIGYLSQSGGFYDNFKVTEMLSYIALIKGIKNPKNEINKVLGQVNLTEQSKKKVKELSGGMRQRLGIAQALIGNPDILILDEPTAGLDPQERFRLRNIISSLGREKIIIIATHIISDVELISDNVLLMNKGRLIVSGTVDELTKSIQNKVWIRDIASDEINTYIENYKISNIKNLRSDTIRIRFLAETRLDSRDMSVSPTLEDVCLYYLGA